jgi:hypothetical protein
MKSTYKVPDHGGYPWTFLNLTSSWVKTTLGTLAITGASILFLIIYTHFSSDLTPDSLAGYLYAIVGTILMLLAALSYTIHRKSQRRRVGSLNNALNWHICFGLSALIVLFLHSFGNFNPRTGTYALYGMIALVISGIVGRAIDRIAPRLITREARTALTEVGDDRLEQIAQTAQDIVTHNSQKLRAFNPTNRSQHSLPTLTRPRTDNNNPVTIAGNTLPGSWDIAYITLDETPQEMSRHEQQYRFVPERKSPLLDPGALIPGYDQQITEIQRIQRAMQREQFYRTFIRAWRVFHILLALLTIGLTLWHLEYAASLLLPMLLKLHH